jgi:hypothetical protein
MDFSMPGFAKMPERSHAPRHAHSVATSARLTAIFLASFLLAAFFLGGCRTDDEGRRFQVHEVSAKWAAGELLLSIDQKIQLSGKARRALRSGVPLTIMLEVSLREHQSQTRVINLERTFVIEYLPLSERYQLTLENGANLQTFARLRHLLNALANQKQLFETGALPNGDYELLVRVRLDRERMPPPMRLPMMFSSGWSHDSSWTAWPLSIGATG